MKKLILITMLLASYGLAMEYTEPSKKAEKKEDKTPAARITRIENESNYDVEFQINGKSYFIAKQSAQDINLPLAMQSLKKPLGFGISHEFESKQKMAIANPNTKSKVITFKFFSAFDSPRSQYEAHMIIKDEQGATTHSTSAKIPVSGPEKPTFHIEVIIKGWMGEDTDFNILGGA